eukprot:3128818-Lingulodinium_polyedra.AAC.1
MLDLLSDVCCQALRHAREAANMVAHSVAEVSDEEMEQFGAAYRVPGMRTERGAKGVLDGVQ